MSPASSLCCASTAHRPPGLRATSRTYAVLQHACTGDPGQLLHVKGEMKAVQHVQISTLSAAIAQTLCERVCTVTNRSKNGVTLSLGPVTLPSCYRILLAACSKEWKLQQHCCSVQHVQAARMPRRSRCDACQGSVCTALQHNGRPSGCSLAARAYRLPGAGLGHRLKACVNSTRAT